MSDGDWRILRVVALDAFGEFVDLEIRDAVADTQIQRLSTHAADLLEENHRIDLGADEFLNDGGRGNTSALQRFDRQAALVRHSGPGPRPHLAFSHRHDVVGDRRTGTARAEHDTIVCEHLKCFSHSVSRCAERLDEMLLGQNLVVGHRASADPRPDQLVHAAG